MSVYAEKIDTLLAKMFSLQEKVLPANKGHINFYLFKLWQSITELTSAFRRVDRDDKLLARFQTYVDAEENRLRSNLETFKYDIDAMDTLELVMGPGRVEKVRDSTTRWLCTSKFDCYSMFFRCSIFSCSETSK